jgi:hypothetical protein
MYRGYVKLWRKSLDSAIFDNPVAWKMWCWCLMKATHKECDQIVGFQTIHLMPGEFIFGRMKVAEELDITERSVRTCIELLKKLQNVTIKTTNKFSIVSVVNWESYQGEEINNDHQNDQQLTNKRPTTDQQLTTNKNDKNVKNEKKTTIGEIPEGIKRETWDAFVEMRKAMKAPLTAYAANLIFDNLKKLSNNNGQGMNLILEQSIANNWKGVFQLKGENENARNNSNFTDRKRSILQDDIEREAERINQRWEQAKTTKDPIDIY